MVTSRENRKKIKTSNQTAERPKADENYRRNRREEHGYPKHERTAGKLARCVLGEQKTTPPAQLTSCEDITE